MIRCPGTNLVTLRVSFIVIDLGEYSVFGGFARLSQLTLYMAKYMANYGMRSG